MKKCIYILIFLCYLITFYAYDTHYSFSFIVIVIIASVVL